MPFIVHDLQHGQNLQVKLRWRSRQHTVFIGLSGSGASCLRKVFNAAILVCWPPTRESRKPWRTHFKSESEQQSSAHVTLLLQAVKSVRA